MSTETLEKEKKELFPEIASSEFLSELKKIKEEQSKISTEIAAIRRFIRLRQIWFMVQVLMIAIPVILGIIFLPGYLKELVNSLPDKLYY